MNSKMVDLYEDNAGGLVMVCGDSAYPNLERLDSSLTFAALAEIALGCLSGDLEAEPSEDYDLTHDELIATYDGSVEIIGRPGVAGYRFLGL